MARHARGELWYVGMAGAQQVHGMRHGAAAHQEGWGWG